MTAFIGVDPGLSGAIAVLLSTSKNHPDIVKILPIPLAGKEIDVSEIRYWLNAWLHLDDEYIGGIQTFAYIEKVSAFPGQGVTSIFKFGFTTGVLHGVIRTLGIPLYTVTPQAWKKEILAGTDKSKQAAIDYVLKAYPGVSLFRTDKSKVYDHNIAEAICIAEYGKRKHSGNSGN